MRWRGSTHALPARHRDTALLVASSLVALSRISQRRESSQPAGNLVPTREILAHHPSLVCSPERASVASQRVYLRASERCPPWRVARRWTSPLAAGSRWPASSMNTTHASAACPMPAGLSLVFAKRKAKSCRERAGSRANIVGPRVSGGRPDLVQKPLSASSAFRTSRHQSRRPWRRADR